MFDEGYSGYMRNAYPLDNLRPLSCDGEDWQSGVALTLVDTLDTLLLMGRRSDAAAAAAALAAHADFEVDAKVWMCG
eukprot:365824-Chlamydomonas_euryale.AAC.10